MAAPKRAPSYFSKIPTKKLSEKEFRALAEIGPPGLLALAEKTEPGVCPIHKKELICPSCRSSDGGNTTAERHAEKLARWGRLGGRPKKSKS